MRLRNSIEREQKLKAWIQHYGVNEVGPYVNFFIAKMLEIDMPYKETELEKADRLQNDKTFCLGDFFGLSDVHRGSEKAGLALEVMLLKAISI